MLDLLDTALTRRWKIWAARVHLRVNGLFDCRDDVHWVRHGITWGVPREHQRWPSHWRMKADPYTILWERIQNGAGGIYNKRCHQPVIPKPDDVCVSATLLGQDLGRPTSDKLFLCRLYQTTAWNDPESRATFDNIIKILTEQARLVDTMTSVVGS